MKKGEKTREHIIQKAAELFNQRGYAGSSMNDIIAQTGIQKGGIYRHFDSKDDIAFAAYDYAAGVVGRRFAEEVAKETSAAGKLLAHFRVYADAAHNPPFIGGCPLQNTAVESDDTHQLLREKAQAGLAISLDGITAIILSGIESGEFRPDLNAEALASFTLSLLEGGIMLSRLEGSNRHMETNTAAFVAYLEQSCLRRDT
ncbi:TetR/AcrR family transcriptional regulator [Paenibacillus methanolicus]|uniref:AcrR family transcriptional regulator n=1 Tax=Paenibacillus methanolicus TaxID=582686 RepID=A0A5S5C7P0_9BACL|nr:TetR/AcrR family transcriptional regulator [Paenibacillus methanolicus]TYP75431.1 AcrR family transcriptional regulator [Paenibacillus methanolicus]